MSVASKNERPATVKVTRSPERRLGPIQDTDRLMTMTSCNPRFGSQERIIAYALLEGWQPASAGPPAEIAAQVAAATGGS